MKPIFLYVLELYVLEDDTDAAGPRFKMGVMDANYTDIDFDRPEERSYATLNDLCASLREAVVVPIYPDIARLRAAVEGKSDFFMEITLQAATRLGLVVPVN